LNPERSKFSFSAFDGEGAPAEIVVLVEDDLGGRLRREREPGHRQCALQQEFHLVRLGFEPGCGAWAESAAVSVRQRTQPCAAPYRRGAPSPVASRLILHIRAAMLYTIAVVLLILWLLGLVSSYTVGGFIHILLIVAIVMILVNFNHRTPRTLIVRGARRAAGARAARPAIVART
jgi:hypothetical protein